VAGAGHYPESPSQEATPSARGSAPDYHQPKSGLRESDARARQLGAGESSVRGDSAGAVPVRHPQVCVRPVLQPARREAGGVGLGYGEILAQSVTGLLLFSALMFLLIFIGAVLAIIGALVWGGLLRRVRADIRRDWRRVLVFLAALIVLFLWAEAVGWGTAIVEWIALVLILGLVGFIRSRSSRTNHQPDASTSTQSVMSKGNQPTTTARKPPITASVRRRVQTFFAGRWWRWSIITVFLLTIAVVALTLVMDARLGAARVLHGEAWRSTVGGMPMTSMQAFASNDCMVERYPAKRPAAR
jgi:hypothetical protein